MPHRIHRFFLSVLTLIFPLLLGAQQLCIDSTLIDTGAPCAGIYEPVCGCDGVVYQNACQAESWHGITNWTSGPCANSCEANFLFTQLEDNTFLFYNTSSFYETYTWDFAGDLVVPLPGETTAIYTFTNIINTVCLYIEGAGGCTDTLCLEVYPGASADICNITDCVWPGDANGNTRANNYDLLNIGLGLGQVGPPRPFYPEPANPIAWVPNFSFDWSNFAGPVNFKHLDCDGNGIVEETDVQAIDLNYVPDLFTFSTPTADAPPVYLEFEETEVTMSPDSLGYYHVKANLYVGEPGDPVSDLYGLAFHLNYPHGLVLPYSVTTQYNNDSFFGDSTNVLSVSRDLLDYNIGRYDFALSRKNGQGVNGSGPVASISFIIVGDIIEGRPEPETQFEVELDGLIMQAANGDTLEYSLKAPTVVTFINQVLADDDTPIGNLDIQVFPNPARSHLSVQMEQPERGQLELFNAVGASVLQQPLEGHQTVVNTSQLNPGIYFLVVQAAAGRAVRKVIVGQE